MTSLRPLVIPAAAVVLAAAAPSATAQPRRPVYSPAPWAAIPPPLPTTPGPVRAVIPSRATSVRAVKLLPLAARTAPGDAAPPGDPYVAATTSTGTAAAGRPIPASARGPPL
jgi:hypothetical protein